MDYAPLLTYMRAERGKLDAVIVALEALAPSGNGAAPAAVPTKEPVRAAPRSTKGKKPKPTAKHGGKARTDATVIAKIEQLSRDGVRLGKIVTELGVSWPTVKKYAKPAKAGVASAPAAAIPGAKKGPWI